jgi:hypothetical protein
MAPTSPYKKVLTIPKLQKTQLKVKMKVMVEILPPFLDIHNNMNTKPMTIHLESHGTSKCIFSLKKSNNYMTRFPLFIQEMENKLFTRGFRHPTIKT